MVGDQVLDASVLFALVSLTVRTVLLDGLFAEDSALERVVRILNEQSRTIELLCLRFFHHLS